MSLRLTVTLYRKIRGPTGPESLFPPLLPPDPKLIVEPFLSLRVSSSSSSLKKSLLNIMTAHAKKTMGTNIPRSGNRLLLAELSADNVVCLCSVVLLAVINPISEFKTSIV